MEVSDEHTVELAKKNNEIYIVVEPTNFWASEQTIKDNPYMLDFDMTREETTEAAIEEHNKFVSDLRAGGVAVKVFKQPHPEAYDSVYCSDTMLCFKNEDFPTGLVVQCPMYWPSRRLERNYAISDWIQQKLGYEHFLDLTYFEKEDKALEGRGVCIWDMVGRCLYVGTSNRTHKDVAKALTDKMTEICGKTYTYYMIEALDPVRNTIPFHTSCFFMILNESKIVFSDWSNFKNPAEAKEVKDRLLASGFHVRDVSYDEMNAGATLVCEFKNGKGGVGVLMSKSCRTGMCKELWQFYNERFTPIVIADIEINETVGGSSIECMTQIASV